MTWKVQDIVSQRKEFVMMALGPGSNIRELCRRFGISPRTGYKWIGRYNLFPEEGLKDRSRRPRSSPARTGAAVERRVLELRETRGWGGRKIRHRLRQLGLSDVPAASTISDILRRHEMIDPVESSKHRATQRFEHPRPNDLWQMDFKGHFPMASGRCHPLTVLDDHSRYAIALRACANERGESVEPILMQLFRLYGLPRRMLMDNGPPWGGNLEHPWTPLTVWLMRLGVGVSHGRPYHPQTQGKEERFHRTLKRELLGREFFADLIEAQRRFDAWREIYNFERPHEALDMETPSKRYEPSPRSFPELLAPIEYGPGETVRRVQHGGWISYKGRSWRLCKAFHAQPIMLRPSQRDGVLNVFFCSQRIGRIDLRAKDETIDRVEHFQDHESTEL